MGIIPFEPHGSAKDTKIELKYIPTNKSKNLCCYTYDINIKSGKWITEKTEWGFYFPGDVFIADPKKMDVSTVCEDNKSSDYDRGKDGEPQVIYTKYKGQKQFKISFVSDCESSEKTLLVLCVKEKEWRSLDYENQYSIHGPRAK